MRADPAYRKITAEEFLNIDFGTDRRFELEDGVIVMMTGGTGRHAWVQGNIFHALRGMLKGGRCYPYGSDMGVWVGDNDVRYPDISIYCGDKTPDDLAEERALHDPTVIIEVLSPSTSTLDQGTKLEQYSRLPSVREIVFVDPVNQLLRVRTRQGPESWHDTAWAQPHDLVLQSVGVTVLHADIFSPI